MSLSLCTCLSLSLCLCLSLSPIHHLFAHVHGREFHGKEPAFTNWTHEFKDTLDYIFISPQWAVMDASRPGELQAGPIPTEDSPSDHCAISTRLELTGPA